MTLGQSLGSREVADERNWMTGSAASGQSMGANWIGSAEQGSGGKVVNRLEQVGSER